MEENRRRRQSECVTVNNLNYSGERSGETEVISEAVRGRNGGGIRGKRGEERGGGEERERQRKRERHTHTRETG